MLEGVLLVGTAEGVGVAGDSAVGAMVGYSDLDESVVQGWKGGLSMYMRLAKQLRMVATIGKG